MRNYLYSLYRGACYSKDAMDAAIAASDL